MKLKLLFTTLLLFLISGMCMLLQAQSVEILPDSSVAVHLPSTVVIPDFNDPGWANSSAFFTFISAVVTVLFGFLLQLLPKWRNANIPAVTKIIVVSIVSVALVFSMGGKQAWPAILNLLINSVLFQSHAIYELVGKPLMGRTKDFAASVANQAIIDPNVDTLVGPSDSVKV